MAAAAALLGAAGIGAAGGITQTGLEFVSAKQAFDRSKYVSNRQMKSAQFIAENQPVWAAEGLRRAGFNPILAATRGFPSAEFAPTRSAPAARVPNVVASAAAGVSAARQVQLIDAEVAAARQKAIQESYVTRQVARQTDVVEKFAEARARAELATEQARVLNMMQERQTSSARMREIEQSMLRTFTDRLLMEMGIPGARAMEELYQREPFLRQLHGARGPEMWLLILRKLLEESAPSGSSAKGSPGVLPGLKEFIFGRPGMGWGNYQKYEEKE